MYRDLVFKRAFRELCCVGRSMSGQVSLIMAMRSIIDALFLDAGDEVTEVVDTSGFEISEFIR